MKDLIILVADLDTENVLLGLLPRLENVCGTRNFSFDIKRHPYRDPGCFSGSTDFLRPFAGQYRHALVVFDREGSGQEKLTREAIEQKVESDLHRNGWSSEQIAVIAINPEVENWIWMNSPRVSNALNWKDDEPLYDWLKKNAWLTENADKPERPKEAMETVLRKTRKARSASIYNQIAGSASFANCKDEAFLKMISILKNWFIPQEPTE